MEINYENIPFIISKHEAVLFEDTNVILKTSQEQEDTRNIFGSLVVTSKKISFTFTDDQVKTICIPFFQISYHALSKDKAYVMLQLSLDEDIVINSFGFEAIDKQDILFLFTENKVEAINLFDQISTGSSLNPELQNEGPDIDIEYENGDNIVPDDEEKYIENQMIQDSNMMPDDDYEPYDYTNTVDKMMIFKTEKKKRDLSEIDPRRFEDA